MISLSQTEGASARLAHTISHIEGWVARGLVDTCLSHFEKGTGSRSGCLRSLSSYAQASAIVSLFKNGDVNASKKWWYVLSEIRRELICLQESGQLNILAFEIWALEGLFYLLSENDIIINWYSDFDKSFDKRRVENVKIFDYWTKNFFLALRSEWSLLSERCEHILANLPVGSREKKFLIDHRFYLALAKGDVGEMNTLIEELVSIKMIRRRAALEGGYSRELFCTPAIIYSKIAIRNGYAIEVESPYLPRPWLNAERPDEYPDPYEFLRTETVLG